METVTPERETAPLFDAGQDPAAAEHLFWRQFAEATTAKAFCRSWLPLQCRMLAGVRCAMVLLGEPDAGPYSPVAVWPDAKQGMHHLTGAVQRALKERRGILVPASASPFSEKYHAAYPVEVDGQLHGAVVLGVDESDRNAVQEVMRRLHWGAAWLEVLVRRTQSVKRRGENRRLQQVFDLVVSALEFDRFHAAAMAFVTRMAITLKCDRVSLGFVRGGSVRVDVLSNTAEFGKQTNLMRAVGAAMDEAVDQKATVVFPPTADGEPLVTRAHEELSRQQGAGCICTLPLREGGRVVGALTLERPADDRFDADSVTLCEGAAAIAGPLLHARKLEERWLIHKALAALGRQMARFFGPRYLVRKAVAVLLAAAVAFFATYTTDYRVTATAAVEGAVQRAVPAPFTGYIRDAAVRPGDVARAGDVLCTLDDRDLVLEHVKWSTQKEQQAKEYQAALAQHDRAQVRILRAKIDQAEAQLALIAEQRARSAITAPFDGVVLSGDLSQLLGSPVERGQVLFEMAPLDAYRVIVQVDERDIGAIAVGMEGTLVLPSMPERVFAFVVEKLTPVSTAREGRNYFRVEGRLTGAADPLRPGMEGIGKVAVDRRRLIWIWTHDLFDWLRLQTWRWLP